MGIKVKGQNMNGSTFRMIKYMNGSVLFKGQVYEWGRFGNTGSHTRTIFSPKLPPPHPHLPHEGSTTGFHLLWHTIELAMSTRICLL